MKKNNYKPLTEGQLLRKCREGDTKAFDEIISRNEEYIYSWILSKEKDQDKAEDIYQRTLIKSWKAIGKFKGDSSYSTWANAIARNLVIDDYKKNLRNKEDYLEDMPNYKKFLAESMHAPPPSEKIVVKEKREAVNNMLSNLSDSHRKILKFYYLDDLSYKEIADSMKCSMGTVMSRLFYAKKKALKIVKSKISLKEMIQ